MKDGLDNMLEEWSAPAYLAKNLALMHFCPIVLTISWPCLDHVLTQKMSWMVQNNVM